MILEERCKTLVHREHKEGPVVYWMQRDQRAFDNWALIKAQHVAIEAQQPLVVAFCLNQSFLGATKSHFDFMLKGLIETSNQLREKSISFVILVGTPEDSLLCFLKKIGAGFLVTDLNPLRIAQGWKEKIAKNLNITFIEVDAHNIVPVFKASDKQEFGAYTIRPKINRLLESYLVCFPEIQRHPFGFDDETKSILNPYFPINSLAKYEYYVSISKVKGRIPGSMAASDVLKTFIQFNLSQFHLRNDPNKDVCSGLSTYLHFGQISSQRVALEVIKSGLSSEEFLEELIVRRELSDNFCYYNKEYDNTLGFPNWAKETHLTHRNDIRDWNYNLDQFEKAQTHDPLWNAAQRQMVIQGLMPGYLRMYWAKKILEWTTTPEEAIHIAIYLNDTYQMDGRDPNGYTGIAWALGGLHDRAWGERPVYGKIRYMNYDGCKRKFDVNQYIKFVENL
ncbi:MAG: deoxyribodipyrimidine photo-lyase [Clostridia bacterium]|nr:deoxyribodipyrimidine photo-lyase [Clostridia bacterium]